MATSTCIRVAHVTVEVLLSLTSLTYTYLYLSAPPYHLPIFKSCPLPALWTMTVDVKASRLADLSSQDSEPVTMSFHCVARSVLSFSLLCMHMYP